MRDPREVPKAGRGSEACCWATVYWPLEEAERGASRKGLPTPSRGGAAERAEGRGFAVSRVAGWWRGKMRLERLMGWSVGGGDGTGYGEVVGYGRLGGNGGVAWGSRGGARAATIPLTRAEGMRLYCV